MYYNNERKETYFNFLNEIREGSAKPIQYIFKRLAPIEESWEKDICDFTYDEICKVLASFNAASLGALRKNISVLKTYTDWCCQNRLSIDNINHYVEFDKDRMNLYVNKSTSQFITRDKLYECIHQLKNDSDKFIILALYENVRTEIVGELFLLPESSLNHEEKTITFPNGEVKKLSKELYYLALESCKEEKYLSYTGDSEVFLNTGNIVNSRKNATKDTAINLSRRLKSRLAVIKDICDLPTLTVPKLMRSGLLDNIKTVIKELGITKEEFFGENFEKYVKNLNPNYGVTIENKLTTKTALYDFI